MNLPKFKIRDADGEPSNHEAVHIIYVRELWAEKERLAKALSHIRDNAMTSTKEATVHVANSALAND